MPHLESLLERTDPLNMAESIEACVMALKQSKNDLVRSWLGEPGKLACTEAMGDAVKPYDSELALAVYLRAQAPHKIIRCYAESGEFDKIVQHSQNIGYQEEDYIFLLGSMLSSETSGQCVKLASKLVTIKDNTGKLVVGADSIVEVFVKGQQVYPSIQFLMDTLQSNSKAQGALQTRLFELYFSHDADGAKTLIEKKTYTHYDRRRIAQLLEKHGYTQMAIEHFESITDIRRVFGSESINSLLNGNDNDNWLKKYLLSLNIANAVQCLDSLISNNGFDANNRAAIADLVTELYQDKFGRTDAVTAIGRLNMDREILAVFQEKGWNDEYMSYLLRRKKLNLWSSVLVSGISTKTSFIDQIINVALGPESDEDALSCLIKALTNASLSTDLLAVLEVLVIDEKLDDRSMTNLLLLTAIKLASTSDERSRVMDYAMRLDNYDGFEVGGCAESHELFEEAFAIYRKFGDNKSAMRVLVNHIGDLERAQHFAQSCDDPEVWALLPAKDDSPKQSMVVASQQDLQLPIVIAEESTIEERNGSQVVSPPPIDTAKTLVPATTPDRSIQAVQDDLLADFRPKTPHLEMKSIKKLPPIKKSPTKEMSNGSLQLAEFASNVKVKRDSRKVLAMNSEDVQKWLGDIGLERFSERFARYNGQMLDNLYSLHSSAPEFFCQSLSSKLDSDLDNVILFFGGLCKLYGDER